MWRIDEQFMLGIIIVLASALLLVGMCLLALRAGRDVTATISGLGVRITLTSKSGMKRRDSDQSTKPE